MKLLLDSKLVAMQSKTKKSSTRLFGIWHKPTGERVAIGSQRKIVWRQVGHAKSAIKCQIPAFMDNKARAERKKMYQNLIDRYDDTPEKKAIRLNTMNEVIAESIAAEKLYNEFEIREIFVGPKGTELASVPIKDKLQPKGGE